MRRSILLPFLALLAACTPAAEEPAANQAEPAVAEEEQEPAPVSSLEGKWNVAGIDGGAPGTSMQASFTVDRLTVQSDCVGMHWQYRQDRNIVSFEQLPSTGCGGERMPAEVQIDKTMELVNIAMFSDGGRQVTLSGPGGTVTMTRR